MYVDVCLCVYISESKDFVISISAPYCLGDFFV